MSNLVLVMVFLPTMFGAMVVFLAMFFQRLIEAAPGAIED